MLSSKYVIRHTPQLDTSFSLTTLPNSENRMYRKLTCHLHGPSTSQSAPRQASTIPGPSRTIFSYFPELYTTFWNTSPTNGPSFPAEFPVFVVYSSFQLPVMPSEVAISGSGFSFSSLLTASRKAAFVSSEADVPFEVPSANLKISFLRDSTVPPPLSVSTSPAVVIRAHIDGRLRLRSKKEAAANIPKTRAEKLIVATKSPTLKEE
mmetsp:Transcript_45557/g.76674  ORF Transcript_45557/g.76674 Transcript_45557/m.76674 type:complete len:207 (-) Transcript_45557:365-985(-)